MRRIRTFSEVYGSKEHLKVLDLAIQQVRIPDKLYHVTQEKYVDQILLQGLLIGKERSTSGGNIRGIYLTDAPLDLPYQDTHIPNPYSIEVDIRGIKNNIKLDPEFYVDYDTIDYLQELINELKHGMEFGMVYSTKSIPPSALKPIGPI